MVSKSLRSRIKSYSPSILNQLLARSTGSIANTIIVLFTFIIYIKKKDLVIILKDYNVYNILYNQIL